MSRPPRLYHAVTCTGTACDPLCPIGDPNRTGADPPTPDSVLGRGDPVELDRPNAARVYDCLLGGSHNFAADRAFAVQVSAAYPGAVGLARANRAFLRHAVRHGTEQGIDQFLDLGSGLPTEGSVHATAWAQNPAARIAYVDAEPVAVHYGRAVLADTGATTATGRATVTQADLRRPDQVLADDGVAGLLDFTRPVAVLLIGVLHFVTDSDDPAAILAGYRGALAPGSILVLAQSSSDYPEHPELADAVRAANDRYTDTSTPGRLRSRAELATLLADWKLEPPGLLDVARWPHGQRTAAPLGGYGAITRPL